MKAWNLWSGSFGQTLGRRAVSMSWRGFASDLGKSVVPGTLVAVVLADSTKAIRHLAIVKDQERGGKKRIILNLGDKGQEVAVKRNNIKMLFPPLPDNQVLNVQRLNQLKQQSQELAESVDAQRLTEIHQQLFSEYQQKNPVDASETDESSQSAAKMIVELGHLAQLLFGAEHALELYATYLALASQPTLFRCINDGKVVLLSLDAAKSPDNKGKDANELRAARFLERVRMRLSRNGQTIPPDIDAAICERRSTQPGDGSAEWGSADLAWREEEDLDLLLALEETALGKLGVSLPPSLMTLLAAFACTDPLPIDSDPDGSMVHDPLPEAAAAVLVAIGRWKHGLNLHLKRSLVQLEMPQGADEEATRLVQNPPADDMSGVRNEHGGLALAIDDNTEAADVDDAVSVERTSDGKEWLRIHVADPGRWIALGSELDRVAGERYSSVYLPEETFPMLPHALSRGAASLLRGRPNAALTISAVLDEHGAISEYELSSTLLTAVRQLTYAQADAVLQQQDQAVPPAQTDGRLEDGGVSGHAKVGGGGGETASAHRAPAEREEVGSLLERMQALAELRRTLRIKEGAMQMAVPRASVRVKLEGGGGPDITVLAETEGGSGARGIVQEFMLLAGEVAATYAKDRELPFIYRCQLPAPRFPPLSNITGPFAAACRHYNQVLLMSPAVTMPLPSRHSGLGLRAYAQVTSPIRRYADMLLHHQLKATLRSEPPPFSAPELLRIMPDLERRSAAIQRLQRSSQRFWVLEFLRRAEAGKEWTATVLRVQPQRGRHGRPDTYNVSVLINDLGHIDTVGGCMDRPIAGAQLVVVVESSIPQAGQLALRIVKRT